jgi:hypothetical protein
LAIVGSGISYLMQDKEWEHNLLRMVKAHDSGRVTAYAVADYLAILNNTVHFGVRSQTVGPRCIVAWRYREGGIHKGGGGQQFYTGTIRDSNEASLPTIATGMDIHAIVGVIKPHFIRMAEARRACEPAKFPICKSTRGRILIEYRREQ